jgi:hypothetical protein
MFLEMVIALPLVLPSARFIILCFKNSHVSQCESCKPWFEHRWNNETQLFPTCNEKNKIFMGEGRYARKSPPFSIWSLI